MTEREALKLALEALELCNGAETVDGVVIYTDKEIAAIKEALAQQDVRDELDRGAKTLRETYLAQPEQEPYGWYIDGYGAVIGTAEPKSVRIGEWLPWYTTPPQRTWVGLTDEDLRELGFTTRPRWWPILEDKLKEKNT